MRKKLVLALAVALLFYAERSCAQEAVVSAGGDVGSVNGTVNYSVGQVVFAYMSGSNGNLNQGVQQPYEFFITGISNAKNIRLELSVYPNPTNAVVNLRIDIQEGEEGLAYLLFDIKGVLLQRKNIVSKITEIPMSHLAAASYFLKITNRKGEELQTFKIIKN